MVRLYTKISFSSVTTAKYSAVWVKAVAVVPSGSVIASGNVTLGACKRMTSNVMIVIRPIIIVAVNTVTSNLRNLRLAGSGI